jgi:signal transduction histidine kinase
MQPRWIETLALSGLLVAIAVAGLVGLEINSQVKRITDQVLEYDVELEDRADDLRVAVLDMRHFHRNIAFAGPTRRGLTDFEAAYLQLQTQIDRLAQLGIEEPNVRTPQQLRAIAEHYYADFHPAIAFYDSDPQSFVLVSDDGLVRLAELESAARELDQLGEQRAAAALRSVEAAEDVARVVLLTVLAGLILVGVGLAYLIVNDLREKRRTAAELARALQLKNDFIADASHELRTPLTVLRANAEVALDLDRTCTHVELLEEIVQESERMTRLVENLLFLARSDSDSMPLELELVEVVPFLTELGERASTLAREGGASLRTEVAATGLATIDPSRIEQVVLILVDNAAKYSPAGKMVTLRSTTRGSELIIEVADQGPGISAPDLPLVFERFYRLDKTRSRKQGGAGLGLAIAKSIVEAHGGRIEAESIVNQGTKMRFYLPLMTMSQPAHPVAEHLLMGNAS